VIKHIAFVPFWYGVP